MKLKEGDIFEFAFSENRLCYGQIVSTYKKNVQTIVIFEGLYKSRPEIKEIMEDKILLFGNTFDAKFYHKNWIVIANEKSNLNKIKLPYYKLGIDPVYLLDFFEKEIRKTKQDEEDNLEFKSYVAPIGFELAIKAYYKKSDWEQSYNKLLYSNILKNIALVEDNN